MQVGDSVKVLGSFSMVHPDTYTIVAIREDGTCTLDNGADFDPVYLEKV